MQEKYVKDSLIISLIIYIFLSLNSFSLPTAELLSPNSTGSNHSAVYKENIDGVVSVVNIQNNQEVGSGSGFFYKADSQNAFLMTNHHVIAGANSIKIILNNGDVVAGKVIGSDSKTDIAVISIEISNNTKIIQLGDDTELQIGEEVLAIGSPLGIEFSGTATQGIISGTKRSIGLDSTGDGRTDSYMRVLQTDAAINPGNSGGPLFNTQGKVIGVNSAKISDRSVEGIAFAIPVSTAILIAEEIEKFGVVNHVIIGISGTNADSFNDLESNQKGVYIATVLPGSLAEEVNLQVGDIITEVDEELVRSIADVQSVVIKKRVGDEISIKYIRDGNTKTVTAKFK